MDYYNQSIEEIKNKLKTKEDGLSKEEVIQRQKKYGKNKLPKKKKESIIKLALNEFKNPIILLLWIAVISSFLVGEMIDALAIIFIILIDVIMSTYQENKANNTAESLNKLIAQKVKVLRNKNLESINVEELIIGDIVFIESGDKIGADMRIIESHNLLINESILTGESVHVFKDNKTMKEKKVILANQKNMLFSGTTVESGRAKAIVTAIGKNTELGKIAESLSNTKEEKSPLTIKIEKLSKQISFLFIMIAIIITILLIIKKVPYNEIFLSVIALSVSAMPEGLPLALTMALTIASNKMAKQNVIVRKLNAAESLGSCTTIASDKTGTLTENRQTAKKILFPNNFEYTIKEELATENITLAKEIITLGIINNEAIYEKNKKIGDSIDLAFQALKDKFQIEEKIQKIEIIPYESENKYSAAFYEQNNEIYCTVKGSLEKVKTFCKDINLSKEEIASNVLEKQNESLAKEGYRIIAIAKGKIKKQKSYDEKDIKNLTFMGMIGFIDPVRKEVAKSIKECHEAGIKVLMITGDHPLTAYRVAKELDIVKEYQEVITGEDIDKFFQRGEKNFDTCIQEKRVFARVTPIQKLKIVESLKRQGEFVAVTGDGVNDASALKAANIGIAMGSGTDIARETADMIIMDDNFTSIVAGIKEGRVAYANIRKIIYFLISCGLAEVIFFCLSILLDLPLPLVAIQLLWLNVVTDGIQDMALSFEKAEENILKEKPKSPQESIFNKSLWQEILVSGTIIGIFTILIWFILLKKYHMDIYRARGYIMALMVFIQNIHVFNCRSEKKSAFKVPLKNNWFIAFGVIITILLQMIIMEIPFLTNLLQTVSVPLNHLIILFFLSFIILISMELYKLIQRIFPK